MSIRRIIKLFTENPEKNSSTVFDDGYVPRLITNNGLEADKEVITRQRHVRMFTENCLILATTEDRYSEPAIYIYEESIIDLIKNADRINVTMSLSEILNI